MILIPRIEVQYAMRITVDSIPAGGRSVKADPQIDWARMAAKQALQGEPNALTWDVRVTRQGKSLKVHGTGSTRYSRICDRCQASVFLDIGGDVDLLYRPEEPENSSAEVELSEEDLDVGWFDGRALDMKAVLCEQLALWVPQRVLCEDLGVTRKTPGPCVLPDYDSGPDLERHSPFANLTLPKTS